ncbi:MAG: zf-HC2 domain-containing protein [Actinomycetota bacterium]
MSDLHHGFDETLVSGYLDGELTQGDAQKVRIHLEDCADCRSLADELNRIKETTMSTEFQLPEDNQWDEAPRSASSSLLRSFGWAIGALWLVVVFGYMFWLMATESEDLFAAVLGFGFWFAIILIFLSVLIDRLKTRKTDRYREVEK